MNRNGLSYKSKLARNLSHRQYSFNDQPIFRATHIHGMQKNIPQHKEHVPTEEKKEIVLFRFYFLGFITETRQRLRCICWDWYFAGLSRAKPMEVLHALACIPCPSSEMIRSCSYFAHPVIVVTAVEAPFCSSLTCALLTTDFDYLTVIGLASVLLNNALFVLRFSWLTEVTASKMS